MRTFLFTITFLFFVQDSFCQISKESIFLESKCSCSFKIIYADSIENETLRLSRYHFVGINKFNAKIWRKRLNFTSGLTITMNELSLTEILNRVCTKRMKNDLFIEAKKEISGVEKSVQVIIGYLNEKENDLIGQ